MVILATPPSAQSGQGRAEELALLARSLFDVDVNDVVDDNDAEILDGIAQAAQEELQRIETENPSDGSGYSEEDGRIGNTRVVMRDRGEGRLKCDDVTGRVASTMNFGSALGTAGVIKGQWMYEVTLTTSGIQQVGWATLQCQFTTEEGVGDTFNSYAYDGKRRKKWNISAREYGERWTPGDVVGVCIDLDACEVSFALNGQKLGVAFSELRTFEPHLAYFPAVSLSEGEASYVNLGSRPFRYPLDGFRPLMAPPPPHRSKQCEWLLQKLRQVCLEPPTCASPSGPLHAPAPIITPPSPISPRKQRYLSPRPPPPISADQVLVAGTIANLLSRFTNDSYAIEECFVPWLLSLQELDPPELASATCTRSPQARRSTPLATTVQLLEAVLDTWELKGVVEGAFQAMALRALGATVGGNSPGSYPYVAVAATVFALEGRSTDVLLKWGYLKEVLELLLVLRQPSDAALKLELPEVVNSDGTSLPIRDQLGDLRKRVEAVQRAQASLLRPLFFYPASAVACLESVRTHSGSETAFHAFVLLLVRANVGVLRQVPPTGISHGSTMVNLFFVVVWFLGPAMRAPCTSLEAGDTTEAVGSPTHSSAALDALPGPLAVAAAAASQASPQPSAREGGVDLTAEVLGRGAAPVSPRRRGRRGGAWKRGGSTSSRESSRDSSGSVAEVGRASSSPRHIMSAPSTFWNFPAAALFVADDISSEPYLGLNRVGGILSEAAKNVPEEDEALSADVSDIEPTLRSSGFAAHNLHSDTPQRHRQPLAHRLVDLAALLYTVGLQANYQRLSAQVRTVHEVRSRLTKLSARLNRALASADESAGESSDVTQLRNSHASVLAELASETRSLEWHQEAATHGGWKSSAIAQLSIYLSHLLRRVQENSPNVWSHVPELYVEFAVCAYHALQRHQPVSLLPATRHVALLLLRLLGDPRVVTPTMRDVVLQSVTNLLATSTTLSAIAQDDEVMDQLLPGIFALYGPEHWTTLSPTLLRAIGRETLLGTVDGPLPDAPPPAAISAVRARIAALCEARAPSSMHFVQSLFSALDWAVTEVTVSLRAASSRPGRALTSSQRRRLLVFFSIAVTCTQLVEFLVVEVPTLFLTGPPVLADRLAEMLAFLVVHAPVDSSSDNYRALTAASASIDRAGHLYLHPLNLARPIVAMLAALRVKEREARASPEGASSSCLVENSVIERLCAMPAACPTAYLAFLPDALLSDANYQEPPSARSSLTGASARSELRAQCDEVAAMVEEFVVRRAAGGGTGDDEVPDEFVDPITMTCMVDPVRCPDSGVVVDRGTIERHLEESATDPYTRKPLNISEVEPMDDLRQEIVAWRSGLRSARAAEGQGDREGTAGAETIRSHVPDSWEVESGDGSS